MVRKRLIIGLLIVVLALSVLVLAPLAGAQESSAPYWPTEGWRTSTPEEQGMDSEKLAKMLEAIEKENWGFHNLLVIRHGYVVLDASTYPFQSNQPHWMSTSRAWTKAFGTSSLKRALPTWMPERKPSPWRTC
jgi:hypothetical protein